MRLLLLYLFLIPTLSYSQDKSFIAAEMGIDWPEKRGAQSFRFHGGAVIDKVVFLGVGAGITKIDKIDGVYVPVFLSIGMGYLPDKFFYPIIWLQPGYGYYKKEHTVGSLQIKTTGGLTFYSGIGIGFGPKAMRIQATGGYSFYSFKTNDTRTNFHGPAIRVSVVGFLD